LQQEKFTGGFNKRKRRIPKETINRLPLYLRCLQILIDEGKLKATSQMMSDKLHLNPHLVRKDLSRLGGFGTQGVGYPVKNLASQLRSILQVDQKWEIALVGVGNIGSALLTYQGFDRTAFNISLAFDQDTELIGEVANGVRIEHVSKLTERVQEESIKLGIIAVPATSAQKVADRLVDGGVKGILNFALPQITVPEPVTLAQVSLIKELEKLSFYL